MRTYLKVAACFFVILPFPGKAQRVSAVMTHVVSINTLAGSVYSASNRKPIKDATLIEYAADSHTQLGQTHTDEDGKFQFEESGQPIAALIKISAPKMQTAYVRVKVVARKSRPLTVFLQPVINN